MTRKAKILAASATVAVVAVVAVAMLLVLADRAVFELAEVPVPQDTLTFAGQYAAYSSESSLEVTRYPVLSTESALYGRVVFDEDKKAGRAGMAFDFALEESKGKGKGFDRLHFDLNRNRDLTDDEARTVVESRPTQRNADKYVTLIFGDLMIPFDFGQDVGTKTIRVIPAFTLNNETQSGSMHFVLPTERQGKIRLPDGLYDVTLRQERAVTGRYDRPGTQVYLKQPDRSIRVMGEPIIRRPARNLQGSLNQMWYFRRAWYTLRAAPAGDRLFLDRYKGDVGGLEVRAGKQGEVTGVSGVYLRSESTWFGVSDDDMRESAHAAGGGVHAVPVGDYACEGINIQFGQRHVSLYRNYVSDGKERDWEGHQPPYSVKVRKGQTTPLVVPATANLVFASPVGMARFRPGDTVRMRMAVIEPTFDLLLGYVQDLSGPLRRNPATGMYGKFPRRTLQVSDSRGNVLFDGDIEPQSAEYYRSIGGYDWKIPEDIALPSGEETLTLTVTVDTWDIFGEVTGTRQMVVESPTAAPKK